MVWSKSNAGFQHPTPPHTSSCDFKYVGVFFPRNVRLENQRPSLSLRIANSGFRCRFFLLFKWDKRMEKRINEVWKTMGCRDEKPLHCVQSIKTRRNRRDTLISVLLVLTLMAIIGGMMLYLFHWLKLFSCWEKSILWVVGWQRHHFRIDGGCQMLSLVDFCSLLRF